jgi:hypothetical protein
MQKLKDGLQEIDQFVLDSIEFLTPTRCDYHEPDLEEITASVEEVKSSLEKRQSILEKLDDEKQKMKSKDQNEKAIRWIMDLEFFWSPYHISSGNRLLDMFYAIQKAHVEKIKK